MARKGYLAMTAAEFQNAPRLPANIAWMACHFSCYGTGLSNLPQRLPPGSMIIVNDRTPVCGHDPVHIARQLQQLVQQLQPSCILLDLQRPDVAQTAQIATHLLCSLSCPVIVSEHYAEALDCPVFLSMPAPHMDITQYLSNWKDREIWLELATDAQTATVTANGCQFTEAAVSQEALPWFDKTLCCHYATEVFPDKAVFHLQRDLSDVMHLARSLDSLSMVGLYQQLGYDFFEKTQPPPDV